MLYWNDKTLTQVDWSFEKRYTTKLADCVEQHVSESYWRRTQRMKVPGIPQLREIAKGIGITSLFEPTLGWLNDPARSIQSIVDERDGITYCRSSTNKHPDRIDLMTKDDLRSCKRPVTRSRAQSGADHANLAFPDCDDVSFVCRTASDAWITNALVADKTRCVPPANSS